MVVVMMVVVAVVAMVRQLYNTHLDGLSIDVGGHAGSGGGAVGYSVSAALADHQT